MADPSFGDTYRNNKKNDYERDRSGGGCLSGFFSIIIALVLLALFLIVVAVSFESAFNRIFGTHI